MIFRVLVLEDDVILAKTLQQALERKGYQVAVSHSLKQAFTKLSTKKYELSIIDRTLVDGDGLEMVEYADNAHYSMKTLIMSGNASLEQRLRGLQAGASDYLAKPFSYQELELKVHKLLLSDKRAPVRILRYRNIVVNTDTGELSVSGQRKHIRYKELAILACLMRHQCQVVTREVILKYVWGSSPREPDFRTIDVYVRRVRGILGYKGAQIHTIRSFGFRLQ